MNKETGASFLSASPLPLLLLSLPHPPFLVLQLPLQPRLPLLLLPHLFSVTMVMIVICI